MKNEARAEYGIRANGYPLLFFITRDIILTPEQEPTKNVNDGMQFVRSKLIN